MSAWQDPEEGWDAGYFLMKILVPLMLLRVELLRDLPENCKEAARQTRFNLLA